MPRNPDRALETGDEFQRAAARYLNEDEEHYDPPPGRKLEILWNEYKYRKRTKADRREQMRVYAWWAGCGAALATMLSAIIGNIPWPKIK